MRVKIQEARETGPFTFRWSDGEERFDRGWQGHALLDGREIWFRHGLGRRQAYGRPRAHSVT